MTIHTLTTGHLLLVPTEWASEERVRAFVEGFQARCHDASTPAGTPAGCSFADELKMLADLKAAGQLTDAEVAEAIRKLMAT